MLSVFDEVLEILSDGKYHSFNEVLIRCSHFNENQLEATFAFLANYGFLYCKPRYLGSTRTGRVKLSVAMLTFLKRLKELEGSEGKEAATS